MTFNFFFKRKNPRAYYETLIHEILDEMILIPGGSFLMGATDGEEDERPIHNVLVNSFYLSKYEITLKQWKDLMGTEPVHEENNRYFKMGNRFPVVNVNWYEAKEFIAKLNDVIGHGFRLPTEAEWEYACRAGSKTKFSHGQLKMGLSQYAWYYDNAFKKGEMYPHEVGTRKPNKFGLYDMMGNVYEWCFDWYGRNYYAESQVQNPQGPVYGSSKVVRGGDWARTDYFLRVTSRRYYSPHYRDVNVGFRLARNVEKDLKT